MSFKEIEGQDRALRIVQGIIRTGKIASAYIFSGEEGIGKYTTALEFAKILNCDSSENADSCDRCRSCRKISMLNHPDIKVVEPENGLINVEQIRGIEEFLSYTPYEGRKKIVIVDDADMMNMYSSNAFLKTLEEPPENSVIILVSSKQEMLSDTIRSRCLNIGFTPLPEAELQIAAKKMDKTDMGEIQLRLAMGKVGKLYDEEMTEKRDIALGIFEDMLSGREIPVPKDRDEINEFIDYFLLFMRDMVVYLCTEKRDKLFNVDSFERIGKLCKENDLQGIINYYSLLSDLKKYTGYNLNKSILFNYLLTLLSSMGRSDYQS